MAAPFADFARLTHQMEDGKRIPLRDACASVCRQSMSYDPMARYIQLTWPEFTTAIVVSKAGKPTYYMSRAWNPWLERNLQAFTNTTHVVKRGTSTFRFIGLTGCASASKSHCCALYALAWWMLDPHNSIAVLTSTTVQMIRHRLWPVITHYAQSAIDMGTGEPYDTGHLIDSQMELRASKTDAKHAVFALAVAHGETQKAIHNLKGMHAERMLLVVDEANGTPEAIFEVIGNMRTGARDVTVIIVGNPYARIDPHGRALTPADGWAIADNPDTIQWASKGVPEWELEPGLVLRFDGRDSPNVRYKKDVYSYLFKLGDWQGACDLFEKTGGNLTYWTQKRGLWPPSGFEMTVFNEQLFARCLDKNDAAYTFDSADTTMLAFFDPAFTAGGDEAWLQFAKLGMVDGRPSLQLTEGFDIPISPDVASFDVDYQLARRVQQECVLRKVTPGCFGLDASGGGRGVASILAAEWGNSIYIMQWGGAASEQPQQDGRPAKERFFNRVAELWFNVRDSLEAGQLRGFTRRAMQQGCSRMYELQGKKYKLEPKPDMKARVRYSPDEMDAIAGLVSLAFRHGFSISGKQVESASREWLQEVKQAQSESALVEAALVAGAEEGGWCEMAVSGGWD